MKYVRRHSNFTKKVDKTNEVYRTGIYRAKYFAVSCRSFYYVSKLFRVTPGVTTK